MIEIVKNYKDYRKEFIQYSLKNKIVDSYMEVNYEFFGDLLAVMATGLQAKQLNEYIKSLDKKTKDKIKQIADERLSYCVQVFIECFRNNMPEDEIIDYILNLVKIRFNVNNEYAVRELLKSYGYLFI